MTRRLALLVLAAALLVSQPAPSGAQVPDERAAAQQFAYAAYRLRVKVKALAPQMRQAGGLLRTCPDLPSSGVDSAGFDAFLTALSEIYLGAVIPPLVEPLRTFQAELDAIPTADPDLRSGRASWRESAAVFARIRPVPADLCDQLVRWAAVRYAPDAAPQLQPRELAQGGAILGDDAKLRRAERRMIALGVPAWQARRFTGVTMLRDYTPEDFLDF